MTPLLPCPFCGKSNAKPFSYLKLHAEDEPDNFVQCQECGTMGPGGNTPPFNDESAIREWNTRAPEVARQIPRDDGSGLVVNCPWCGKTLHDDQAKVADGVVLVCEYKDAECHAPECRALGCKIKRNRLPLDAAPIDDQVAK